MQAVIDPAMDISRMTDAGLGRPLVTSENYTDGLYALLPKLPVISTESDVVLLTGFNKIEQSGPDDASPTGFMKGCTVELPFAQYKKQTNCIELNRAFADAQQNELQLQQALNLITMAEMQTAGLFLERELQQEIWVGFGSRVEDSKKSYSMVNLQDQIEGRLEGVHPATVGDVKDFKKTDVGSTEQDIVEYLSMIAFYTWYTARRSSLAPATWAICMRPELWFELSAILPMRTTFRPEKNVRPENWTCGYCGSEKSFDLTACVGSCGAAREPINGQYICLSCGRVYFDEKVICWDTDAGTGCGAIKATQQVQDIDGLNCVIEGNCNFRDWMRDEQKMFINGSMYDVVLDWNIPEQKDGQGVFWSNLYFVPMTIGCDLPVTYIEYLNYRELDRSVLPDDSFWTDNGLYAWTPHQEHWDFMLSVQTQQRIVTLTPQLSGVIKDIAYRPLQHLTGATNA